MGGKSDNSAAEARQDEQERQDRVRAGTKRVNTIFDGGSYGTGALDAGGTFDPAKQYFDATGAVWKPTTANPGNEFEYMTKRGMLFGGAASTSGFNDNFFANRRKSFIDYASPQLDDQYGKAKRELTFALDRGKLLNSSVRGQKGAELQQLYDINKQKVADDALSFETQARTSVEDARGNLISTLNATGDAEGAASSAIARSSALSQPAAYSPLGQLFQDFTAGLGVQAAQERAAAASGGAYRSRYDTGLFGGTPGRVKVV